MKVIIKNGYDIVVYNHPRIMSVSYDFNQEQYMFIVDGYEVGYVDNKERLMTFIQMDKDIVLNKTFFKQYEVKEWGEL